MGDASPNEEISGTPVDSTNALPTITHATRKKVLHDFLDNPKSSSAAFYYSVCMLLLILCFTVVFLVSSLPQYYGPDAGAFKVIQQLAGSIFTVDYVLRLITAPRWYKWALSIINLLDLAVVIPFLLNLIPSVHIYKEIIALRAIRLLVLFKLIKVTRYGRTTKILVRTLKKSKDGFVIMTFALCIFCVFYSTLIFLVENVHERFDSVNNVWYRDDGSKSDFQSIFDAMWWCMVTFTTVGYGDTFPVTVAGKIVAVITMLTGVLIMALPIAIFTTNFMELYREQKREDKISTIIGHNLKRKIRLRPISVIASTQTELAYHLHSLLKAAQTEERECRLAIASAQESMEQAMQNQHRMQRIIKDMHNVLDQHLKIERDELKNKKKKEKEKEKKRDTMDGDVDVDVDMDVDMDIDRDKEKDNERKETEEKAEEESIEQAEEEPLEQAEQSKDEIEMEEVYPSSSASTSNM